jgi:hypothetical protein
MTTMLDGRQYLVPNGEAQEAETHGELGPGLLVTDCLPCVTGHYYLFVLRDD